MASKVLAIEVGKRIVKVCETAKTGKSYKISSSFIFNAPENSVYDGQIMNPVMLGDVLAAELKARQIRTEDAVFTLSSSRIASREVTLPAAKDEVIAGIVATNAAEYFPVDVSKYRVAPVILERGKTEVRVNAVAVPNQIIDSYIALADAAHLNIEALDYSGNSQYQVLRTLGGDSVNMFVTVDDASALVTFMRGGKLLLQRAVAFGGDEMVSAYMQTVGLGEEKYVEAMEALSVSREKPNPDAMTAPYADTLTRLVGGIARSTDFFRGAVSGEEASIGRVVLMGSCCHLAGLKEQIASRVGADTVWLEEISGTQELANSILGISMFIACTGSRVAPLGLLPAEYLAKRRRSGKSKESNYGAAVLVLLLFAGLALCCFQWTLKKSAADELARTNRRINELQYVEERYNSYLTYTAADDAMKAYVAAADTENASLRAFFEELEMKMPSDVTFLAASCTAEGVALTVECPSFDEAAVAIDELRTFESIDVISVGTIANSVGSTGIESVSFTMSCLYHVPAAEAAVPAE